MKNWWNGLSKNHRIGVIVVGVLSILIAISASSGGDSGKSGGNAGDGGSDEPTVAELGQPITQEGTTYKVLSADTSDSVGSSFLAEQANGVFVVVDLELTNRKDEPATIISENLELVGGNGSTYTVSDDALFVVDDALLFEEIQPGVTESGKLVYDIPPSALKGSVLRAKDFWSGDYVEIDLGL